MIVQPGQTHHTCYGCEEELPIEDFSVNNRKTYPEGNCRYNYCLRCRAKKNGESRTRGYHKAKEKNPRHWFYNNLHNRHKITPDQVDALMIQSSGLCAICDRPFKNSKMEPHLDHNHKTGAVREFLCSRCNTMVGLVEDFRFLKRAVDYVKRHRKS